MDYFINVNNIGDINSFRLHCPEVFEGPIHREARDRYSLNWLNVMDQLENKSLLSELQQITLNRLIEGDWSQNSWVMSGLKWGQEKDCTFAESLVLLNAVDIGEIVGGAAGNIVIGNIYGHDGFYSDKKSGRRLFDARAAQSRINDYMKKLDLVGMQDGKRSIPLIFRYPSENTLIHVGENILEARESINRFYKHGHEILVNMLNDKNCPVKGFMQSNEITCHSIRKSLFNPHIHAIVWIDSSEDFAFLQNFCSEQVGKYNRGEEAIHLQYQLESEFMDESRLLNYAAYMGKATTLVQVYKREYQEEDLREFNIMTREAHHKMNQIWSGAGGRSMQRKFLKRKIKKFSNR